MNLEKTKQPTFWEADHTFRQAIYDSGKQKTILIGYGQSKTQK